MNQPHLNIDTQLTTADRLAQECETLRQRYIDLQRRLNETDRERQAELARVQQTLQTELEAVRSRITNEAARDLETLALDRQTRRQTLQENLDNRVRAIAAEGRAAEAECEEKRRSELWVLQSVLDEDAEDTPVAEFERELDTFHTHQKYLAERMELLQQQKLEVESYLGQCHTSVDQDLPPAQLTVRRRVELRDSAVQACDEAVRDANDLYALHLPNWVRGWRLFGFGLIAALVLWIGVTALRADLRQFLNADIGTPDWEWAGVSALIAIAIVVLGGFVVQLTVQGSLRHRYQQLQQKVSNALAATRLWEQKSEKYLAGLEERAEKWRTQVAERRQQQLQKIQSAIDQQIDSIRTDVANRCQQLTTETERQLQNAEDEYTARQRQIEQSRDERLVQAETDLRQKLDSTIVLLNDRFRQQSAEMLQHARQVRERWQKCAAEIQKIAELATARAAATLDWPSLEGGWKLPDVMPSCVSVGNISSTFPIPPEAENAAEETRLRMDMPALLSFPAETSILVEHDAGGREAAVSFLRRQILKLLTVIPAGRIRLTLIDPIGLGQSFSAMMHLADFDELLIHNRIWTESTQIRQQLQKVTEHMENIFQTYLRSQFETIEEYNASAGEVAEPYHFVVIAGFPTAFTDESARHLSSILTSGARCGVHALVAWNPAVAVPPSFDSEDLTSNCMRFVADRRGIRAHTQTSSRVTFEAFPEPPADEYVQLVRAVGEQSKDARRVEVSFTRIAPRGDEIWSHSTADGIDLPIGRAGAARLQFMRLGRGTSQHVLVAGKTGSGKSTFLHILITNLALHYSPREIQFYLIDFKKGVEFRTYAAHRLPHARVVAIESDREFGLSVLERLDEILQERGELFRERGVQDVPSFRERFPDEPMPRLLLLIDEFQEFFVAEDRVSSRASLLLDRLVRQGRAFGIHVLLGSQTLGGAYSLARSTMGQIAVRIALQCSESDAHLILSEDNSAARLLSRPGEAIYNDANGMVQGNHQFQIAWLDEARRESAIAEMLSRPQAASLSSENSMIVFEGNVPPTSALCGPLNAALRNPQQRDPHHADVMTAWLGEPVAIAAPTTIEFRRASGQNVLIVGQDDNQVDSILAHTAISLCGPVRNSGQNKGVRFEILCDRRASDSVAKLNELIRMLSYPGLVLHTADECDGLIVRLYQQMLRREEGGAEDDDSEDIVLAIRNVGQFRSLRKDDDDFGLGGFGEPKELQTAGMLTELLKRGPIVGFHILLWSDTYSNAVRWLSSSALREFESRIAFRMNQTDSASLVDSPVAAGLGPGRAIVYRDQTGTVEKFRPFAWPGQDWLRDVFGEPPQQQPRHATAESADTTTRPNTDPRRSSDDTEMDSMQNDSTDIDSMDIDSFNIE